MFACFLQKDEDFCLFRTPGSTNNIAGWKKSTKIYVDGRLPSKRMGKFHQTFQVPKMEEFETQISCMDTAYSKGNPTPKVWYFPALRTS